MPPRTRAALACGLNTIKDTTMKTMLKLTLAVAVAGLLTACAMNGLEQSHAANQSISGSAQTNSEWADRATDQFLDQLTSAAVH